MRTASALLGLLLAAVCVAGTFVPGKEGITLSGLEGPGVAAALAVLAVFALKRRRWAQILLSLGGLALLGRFLPVYFRTTQMWPFLAVIILSSATFGIGILGSLIEGFEPQETRRRRPL
jgi:hypothetical protein